MWWVISLTKFPPLLQKRWFTGILWNSYSEKITQNLKENSCAGLNEIEWRKTIKNKGGYSMLMLKSFALRVLEWALNDKNFKLCTLWDAEDPATIADQNSFMKILASLDLCSNMKVMSGWFIRIIGLWAEAATQRCS